MEIKEINEMIKERDLAVDMLRAFGIIIMIGGHIGFGGWFDKWMDTISIAYRAK